MRCLEKKGLLTMSSQLIGVLAASTQGDADAKSLQTGAWVARNATQHNYLSHWQEEKKRQEVDGCKEKPLCKRNRSQMGNYFGPAGCQTIKGTDLFSLL